MRELLNREFRIGSSIDYLLGCCSCGLFKNVSRLRSGPFVHNPHTCSIHLRQAPGIAVRKITSAPDTALIKADSEEQVVFQNIHSLSNVADLLKTSSKQLRYLLYGRPITEKYTGFTIKKRRGGVRLINAPKSDLKAVQRRLADFLQDSVEFRRPVHGFVRERSIVTNAEIHLCHRTILNIDLKDFFPTINFGRVRGLLMSRPFGASKPVATILAQICCHENALPQGAPTSPVISNLVCYKMDSQLQHLAQKYRSVYSRYADDITISKRKGPFPVELADQNTEDGLVLSPELRTIIEKNGFTIHPDKIHLYRNTSRQTVTGLIVNKQINVPRHFIRDIRAIISDWRINGRVSAEKNHHCYYRNRRSKQPPSLERILEGKLNFLKMVKGTEDPVRRNLQRQLVKVWPDYGKVMEKENKAMTRRDFFISHASEDKIDFVKPLADALIREGVSVWYDEYQLTIGDDLVAKINEGLASSSYGIVVLSPSFFNKKKTWPDREVGALFALEDAASGNAKNSRIKVLPVWHKVDQEMVANVSPILAGKYAWKSADCPVSEMAVKFKSFLQMRAPN